MLQPKLLVVGGGDAEKQEFELTLPATIGRGRENSITLPHALVSRQHCEIFEGEGGLFVRDLGSLNGTYVGNQQINSDQQIRSGDLLTIGIVTFRTLIPGEIGVVDPILRVQCDSVLDEPIDELLASDTRLASGEWDSTNAVESTVRADEVRRRRSSKAR